MGDGIENAARVAAQLDHERGGTDFGVYMASMMQWGLKVKVEHKACGKLRPDTVKKDGRVMPIITCPVHGQIEGPKAPPT